MNPPLSKQQQRRLKFPFRANTIARRAQSPGAMEIQYQLAQAHGLSTTPALHQLGMAGDLDSHRGSGESDTSLDPGAQQFLNDRVTAEETQAQREVGQEIERTEREAELHSDNESREILRADPEAAAALREAQEGSEVEVEDRMQMNAGERQRLRKERLSQKLMDVFGLTEAEEVLEEMRCWLLRSVSELTRSVICEMKGLELMDSAERVHVFDPETCLLFRAHA